VSATLPIAFSCDAQIGARDRIRSPVRAFLPDGQTARSAATRRSTKPAGILSCDDTSRGDAGKRIAQPICFSPVEFRALLHGRGFSRAMVFAQMWRTGEHGAPKTVRAFADFPRPSTKRVISKQNPIRLRAEPSFRAFVAPAVLVAQSEEAGIAEIKPQDVNRLLDVHALAQGVQIRPVVGRSQ
jgi:hypothetical protein